MFVECTEFDLYKIPLKVCDFGESLLKIGEGVYQFPLSDSLRTITTLVKIIFSNIFHALLSAVKTGR